MFLILKKIMAQSLLQEKFKDEIHQQADQLVYLDDSKHTFTDHLTSIGQNYTIVSLSDTVES
jgi:hypothetical protein